MASEQQVKQYLAYWFQLGKAVLIRGGEKTLLPRPVIRGDRYSQEFESCWQCILAPESGDCHLEGTGQTIQQLLRPDWEITSCARCSMPVPLKTLGMTGSDCPCHDLSDWPNTEIPAPHDPVDTQARLSNLRDRLRQVGRQG